MIFHKDLHLESEPIMLEPQKAEITVFATWQCPEMEGWKYYNQDKEPVLEDTNGRRVTEYPERLRFRISAGSKNVPQDSGPYALTTNRPAEEYIRTLKFRLVRFPQGKLEQKPFSPVVERMVGVPAEMPYSERIYRVEFDVKGTPIADRFLLEVWDADGQRVAKFPVFFY